jgi:hypothetical protein
VSIDLVSGLQTILAPLSAGSEPWGLAQDAAGKLYVGAAGSSQLLGLTQSGGSWLNGVLAGDIRLSNAFGLDVLSAGRIAVADGAYGLLVYDSANGNLQKFVPVSAAGERAFGVRFVAPMTLFTELQDDCAPAAAAVNGFEPPNSVTGLATGGLLRCPLALDALDQDEIFVADSASLTGRNARVVRVTANGGGPYVQALVASLPDGSDPTLPADITIVAAPVPEPAATAMAFAAVAVLGLLGRPRAPHQRPDQRSHAEAARPEIASKSRTRTG